MNATRDKTKIKVTYGSITPAQLSVDFNVRLQKAGKDLAYYANTYESAPRQEGETDFLRVVLDEIFVDTSGVETVYAKPFVLSIFKSTAVPREELEDIINEAIKKASGV